MAIKRIKWFLFLLILSQSLPGQSLSAQDIEGTYLMDGYRHRVITIRYLDDDIYSIEERTSQWPWSGCGFVYRKVIYGIARFNENGGSMMLTGYVRSDRSIRIDYVFMTDEKGGLLNKVGPGRGRIDKHVWHRR